jgi:hypothetical protein
LESLFPSTVERVVEANRPKGALFSWMTIQGGGHARLGQEVLAMPLLTITAPQTSWPLPGWNQQRLWNTGSKVTIVVDDAKLPHWQKLEFYDGARKLGEIAKGPPQFTTPILKTGYHVFSVLGTDDQGNLQTSNPVLVIAGK